jgi:hypothetical protein
MVKIPIYFIFYFILLFELLELEMADLSCFFEKNDLHPLGVNTFNAKFGIKNLKIETYAICIFTVRMNVWVDSPYPFQGEWMLAIHSPLHVA